jgi:hypothetical protein
MGGRAASALAVVSLALGAADGCKPDPMREIISFPARDAAVSRTPRGVSSLPRERSDDRRNVCSTRGTSTPVRRRPDSR